MPESLLYIIFKDTVSDDRAVNLKLSINNISDQLIAAADRVQADPEAIYSYLKQESCVKMPVTEDESIAEPVNLVIPLITEEEILNTIFKKIRRTRKSENIIKCLIQNSGMELSVEQLIDGASISKNDLFSWMGTTGIKIPSITKPSRGVYKFNPDKLNHN